MRVRTSGFQQYDLRPSRFDATQKFLSALLWINFHIAILQFYGIFFSVSVLFQRDYLKRRLITFEVPLSRILYVFWLHNAPRYFGYLVLFRILPNIPLKKITSLTHILSFPANFHPTVRPVPGTVTTSGADRLARTRGLNSFLTFSRLDLCRES